MVALWLQPPRALKYIFTRRRVLFVAEALDNYVIATLTHSWRPWRRRTLPMMTVSLRNASFAEFARPPSCGVKPWRNLEVLENVSRNHRVLLGSHTKSLHKKQLVGKNSLLGNFVRNFVRQRSRSNWSTHLSFHSQASSATYTQCVRAMRKLAFEKKLRIKRK